MVDIYQWLARAVKFDGTKNRRNMFLKLERLVRAYGEEVKRVILSVWAESATRHNDAPREHYFCKAVKLRLIDRGMWFERNQYDALTGDDLDACFKDEGPLELFDGKPAGDMPPPPKDMTRDELIAWQKKATQTLANRFAI